MNTLTKLAEEADRSPEWASYATFCSEYERGLRNQALATLEGFIVSMEGAPLPKRRKFVHWLMDITDRESIESKAIPHMLRARLVEPTLHEWAIAEPTNPEPLRWLGKYGDLERALRLDPEDQIARRKLLGMLVNGMEYETHELPSGYVGESPEQGLAALDKAEKLLADLRAEDADQFAVKISEMRLRILSYLQS